MQAKFWNPAKNPERMPRGTWSVIMRVFKVEVWQTSKENFDRISGGILRVYQKAFWEICRKNSKRIPGMILSKLQEQILKKFHKEFQKKFWENFKKIFGRFPEKVVLEFKEKFAKLRKNSEIITRGIVFLVKSWKNYMRNFFRIRSGVLRDSQAKSYETFRRNSNRIPGEVLK